MSFKNTVADDIHRTFLNTSEFADLRTIVYDGETYDGTDHSGIPVVLTGFKEQDRRQIESDHVQGLYLISAVLHCALSDMDGKQPEKGQRIKISDGDGYFNSFYVASSDCELGMLRIELEAIDE